MCYCLFIQDGGTALLLAAMKGHTDIVRDILSLKGVLVNLEDKVSCVFAFRLTNTFENNTLFC